MKGDFTRDTFNKKNFFSRVLMQQGRVTLDADYNEQVEILLHYMRTLARDLIGPHAAPVEAPGFKLNGQGDKDFWISAGRYYVDGILVENETACLYSEQPNYKLPTDDGFLKLKDNPDQIFWVYLDVWEQHITSIDNDAIREKALGGPDTCARAKVMWQVRARLVDAVDRPYVYPYVYPYSSYDLYGSQELPCEEPLQHLVDVSRVRLAARVDPGQKVESACVTPPDSKYRGVENHLYRVEVHRGGNASEATFKWSRDNGSVVTAWLDTDGNDLEVANTRGFSAGNWVELSDDIREQQGLDPGILVRVAKVEGGVLSIIPGSVPSGGLPQPSTLMNPKVRRWDQVETGDIQLDHGAVPVVETLATEDAKTANWIDLEDGIQIAFTQIKFAAGGTYRAGDYWLIPARVASGDIEWPEADEAGKLSVLEPHGIVHHYAPLGFVTFKDNKLNVQRCSCEFEPLSDCLNTRNVDFGGQLLFPGRATRTRANLEDTQEARVIETDSPIANRGITAAATTDETPPKATKKARRRSPSKTTQ